MSDIHMAYWSHSHKRQLIITDGAGKIVDSLTIPVEGDRPPKVFADAAWAPYPGAEWDEEPPGCWSIAVFREEMTGQRQNAAEAL